MCLIELRRIFFCFVLKSKTKLHHRAKGGKGLSGHGEGGAGGAQ